MWYSSSSCLGAICMVVCFEHILLIVSVCMCCAWSWLSQECESIVVILALYQWLGGFTGVNFFVFIGFQWKWCFSEVMFAFVVAYNQTVVGCLMLRFHANVHISIFLCKQVWILYTCNLMNLPPSVSFFIYDLLMINWSYNFRSVVMDVNSP